MALGHQAQRSFKISRLARSCVNKQLFSVLSSTLKRLWLSQHVLVALDAHAHIIDMNLSFCELLEHPYQTLHSQPLAALCAPEAPLHEVFAASSLATSTYFGSYFDKCHPLNAFTLLRPDRSRVPLHVVETWLVKHNGSLAYVLVLATASSKHATQAALEHTFDDIIWHKTNGDAS